MGAGERVDVGRQPVRSVFDSPQPPTGRDTALAIDTISFPSRSRVDAAFTNPQPSDGETDGVAMLSAQGLEKRFGPVRAVRGVSFAAARGEVVGVLGPNGAGKSTTMRMIAGFLEPDAGSVTLAGVDMIADRIAGQRKLGYLPEGAPAYADMTPRGFLRFVADARRMPRGVRREAVERALGDVAVLGEADRPIAALSKGFKRRVGLAAALVHDPEVLLLDEPTDGLDPNQKHAVRGLLRRLAATKTIVVSTHILEEVEAVCTRAVVIANGVVVADEPPAALRARHPSGRLEDAFRALTVGEDAGATPLAAPVVDDVGSGAPVPHTHTPGEAA